MSWSFVGYSVYNANGVASQAVGLPVNVQGGDLIVVSSVTYQSSNAGVTCAALTTQYNQGCANDATVHWGYVSTKIAGGAFGAPTTDSSFTLAFGGGNNSWGAVTVAVYRSTAGVNTIAHKALFTNASYQVSPLTSAALTVAGGSDLTVYGYGGITAAANENYSAFGDSSLSNPVARFGSNSNGCLAGQAWGTGVSSPAGATFTNSAGTGLDQFNWGLDVTELASGATPSSSDTGTGADTQSLFIAVQAVADTEAGTGAEGPQVIRLASSDTGHGTETQGVGNILKSSSDTGTGAEAQNVVVSTVSVSSSDSGTGLDTGSKFVPGFPGAALIAEDLSTPPPVYSGTTAATGQSVTTAPFSPPGSSLLVALVGCDTLAGTPVLAVSDSGGHTWTEKISAGTGETASIWTAPVGAAPGPITVTAANTALQTGTIALVVRVDTGANVVQTGAAAASNTNVLGLAPQVSIPTTTRGSWVYTMCVGGGPELTVRPVNSVTLTLDNYQDTVWTGGTFITGKQITPTGLPGSTLLGWTWTVPHTWSVVALEVLSAGVPVADNDIGHGSETAASVQAQVPAADTGTGTDVTKGITGTGAPSFTSSSDTGTGTDATGSVPVKWVSVGSSDAGSGSDSAGPPPTVAVRSSDFGTGNEVAAVPSMRPTLQFFAMLRVQEGFSLDRVAALSGTSGAESAQLYGAQAITLTPDVSVTAMKADDEDFAAWTDMRKAQLVVTNGYMSFSLIDQLSGPNIAIASSGTSPSDYYGLPLWTQYQHNQPAVPLALRMSSRNANGAIRTLTFVLYKVQLSVLDFTGITYKTGLQVNYAGTVLFSGTDERGNTLASPEIGRIVSAAGVDAGAFAAQPFAGV